MMNFVRRNVSVHAVTQIVIVGTMKCMWQKCCILAVFQKVLTDGHSKPKT